MVPLSFPLNTTFIDLFRFWEPFNYLFLYGKKGRQQSNDTTEDPPLPLSVRTKNISLKIYLPQPHLRSAGVKQTLGLRREWTVPDLVATPKPSLSLTNVHITHTHSSVHNKPLSVEFTDGTLPNKFTFRLLQGRDYLGSHPGRVESGRGRPRYRGDVHGAPTNVPPIL